MPSGTYVCACSGMKQYNFAIVMLRVLWGIVTPSNSLLNFLNLSVIDFSAVNHFMPFFLQISRYPCPHPSSVVLQDGRKPCLCKLSRGLSFSLITAPKWPRPIWNLFLTSVAVYWRNLDSEGTFRFFHWTSYYFVVPTRIFWEIFKVLS